MTEQTQTPRAVIISRLPNDIRELTLEECLQMEHEIELELQTIRERLQEKHDISNLQPQAI